MNTPDDDIHEADIEVATGLMNDFAAALEEAGLWSNQHENGRIRVRVFSRLGTPIELDTVR